MSRRTWTVSSLRLIILSVFVLLHSWTSAYDSRCPPNLLQGAGSNTHVRTYNGKCYQFVGFEKYWWGARDYCWQKGGKLVTISDWYTNRFIVNTLSDLPWHNNGVWIGLNDLRQELTWEWVTERKNIHIRASWSNWGHGHPKGFWHSNRDCVRMNRRDSWRWHETVCQLFAWHYRFICEYKMLTTTTRTTTTTTTRTTPTTTRRTTTTTTPTTTRRTTTTRRPTTTTTTPTTTSASTTTDIFLGFRSKDINTLRPGRLNRKRVTTAKLGSVAAASSTTQHPNAIPAGWQKMQQQKEEGKQGTGVMVGIVTALLLSLLVLIIIIVVLYRRRRRKKEEEVEVIFQNKSLKEECEKESSALLNSIVPDGRPRVLPDTSNGRKQNEYVVNVYQCTNQAPRMKKLQMTLRHTPDDLVENETVTEGTDDEINAETEVKTNAINEAKVTPVNLYVNPTADSHQTAAVPAQASTEQDGYEEPRSSGYLPMNGSSSDDRQQLITPEAEYTPPKPSFQYDSPKPMNIYSEIPDYEGENVYESLENIRRALGEKDV